MERRLAAILAADVVGYSALMETDEEETLVTLSAYRQVIDGLVTDHRGRVFGSAGDSVIAEFSSPVEAVRCAAEIQLELKQRSANLAHFCTKVQMPRDTVTADRSSRDVPLGQSG